MTERWLPIPGYEGVYEVSDLGRVRSLKFGKVRIMTPSIVSKSGHVQVHLSPEGARKNMYVHQAVMLAFVGPRPDGWDTCHNNGDAGDNRLENLRYGTKSSNMRDAVAHGAHAQAAKTHCVHGHEFSEENTRRLYGKRHCRTCWAERTRRWRASA